MNLGQQEKLENLIKISTILNPQERQEWLGLLSLMNGKQLNELEKILSSGHTAPTASPTPALAVKPVTPPVVKAAPTLQPKANEAAGMPKLSHILNLPRIQPIGQKSEIPVVKQKLSFGQRLKSILSEKELPAGKPVNELELSTGQDLAKSKPLATIPEKPKPIIPAIKPPAAAPKLPPFAPFKLADKLPVTSYKSEFKITPPSIPQPPIKPMPDQVMVMPALPKENLLPPIKVGEGNGQTLQIKPSPPVSAPNLQSSFTVAPSLPKITEEKLEVSKEIVPQQVLEPALNKVASPQINEAAPALNWKVKGVFSQPLTNAAPAADPKIKQALADALAEKSKQTGPTSLSTNLIANNTPLHLQQNAAKAPVNEGPKLESLGDLNILSPQSFEDSDLDSVVKKVKNLTAKYGYHEVVFNIEKSPLFKNYINTGVELLNKQTSFERLTDSTLPNSSIIDSQEAKNYLNRREFEKITDLLVQIQAS